MTSTTRLVTRLSAALGRGAAYLDLADALRGLVLDGELVVGDRLPAERTLAAALGVSRTTVTSAMTLLRAEGYLRSRQGSGTLVSLPRDVAERPDEPYPGGPDRGTDIDLTIAILPAPGAVASAATRAAARLPSLLSGPGLHPLGLRELREGLARRLTARGLPATPGQLLITQGALHAWDLVLRAHARPGMQVAVEQPTYPAVIDSATAHHVRLRPLGVQAQGWSLPSRSRSARGAGGRFADIVHVTPDFQNPTGHLADETARRDLLAATRGSMVLVDETFAPLHFGDPVTPTGALRRDVLTAGSLSKHVWAGLRLGWVHGPAEVITRLAVARTSQDLAPPVLEQLIATELLDQLDGIAAARSQVLRARRDHLVGLVERAGWTVSPPAGGMCLWVDLGDVRSTHLALSAAEEGVRVTPGPRFSLSGTHDRYLRLPFCHPEPVLDDAMARLVRAAARPPGPGTLPASRWTA